MVNRQPKDRWENLQSSKVNNIGLQNLLIRGGVRGDSCWVVAPDSGVQFVGDG